MIALLVWYSDSVSEAEAELCEVWEGLLDDILSDPRHPGRGKLRLVLKDPPCVPEPDEMDLSKMN